MFRLDLELLDPPPCVIAPDIIDPAELKLPVNFAVENNQTPDCPDSLPPRSLIMFFFVSFFASFSFTCFKIFFVIVNFQVFVFGFIS